MKLVFAGTPIFAATALSALHNAGHDIVLVLTQPDRPAGRGMKLTSGAVANEAERLGLRLAKPPTLKADAVQAMLRETGADVMIVAAYGLILPPAVLEIPRLGCLNIHGSLLPRWRGAAPIQRAIEAGDTETGITIMQMDAGLDTGPMLLMQSLAIGAEETAGMLTARLADLGAAALVRALRSVAILRPQPQPADGATYASKIDKAEAWLDWSLSAGVLARKVRAYDPFPVAQARLGDQALRIWRAVATPLSAPAEAGVIVAASAAGIDVACGTGCLRLLELQRAGARRLTAREFLAGHPLAPSQRFGGGPVHE